jgi:hypothetical protein
VRLAAIVALVGALGSAVALTSPVAPTAPESSTLTASMFASAEITASRTTMLKATDSAWTSRRKKNTVMASPALRVRTPNTRTYLNFDASTLDMSTVTHLSLRLWVAKGDPRASRILVHQDTGAWSSRTLRHQNAPTDTAPTPLGIWSGKPRPGHWWTIRLSPRLEEIHEGRLSFRLSASRAARAAVFARTGPHAPRVAVTTLHLAPPTEPPTEPPTGHDTPFPEGDPTHNAPRVFAHYFTPYPLSIDNKPADQDYYALNYLTINGENNKHAAYGGLLRDRPAAVTPSTGEWRLANHRTEIRQAKAAGIEGFTIDILSFSGRNWDATRSLMAAADLEGNFAISPMFDATSITTMTPTEVSDALAPLFAYDSAHTIDGDYVLTSFCAECQPVTWWADLIEGLHARHNLPVKFIAGFIGANESRLSTYAPISYGAGSWGTRTAQAAAAHPNWAAKAHALGLTWMQAVAVQDARPRSGVYAEASNTETLRGTWARAIADDADFVQVVTWNDYSESTSFAPSHAHGNVYAELNAYYAQWFLEGTKPTTEEDRIYLTHRAHPWNANPSSGIKNMKPTLSNSTVPPRDFAEALVFLTAPADLTLTSGTHTTRTSLPAGTSTVLVALGTGTTKATLSRNNTTVTTIESPFQVTNSPQVQDLQYFAVGPK